MDFSLQTLLYQRNSPSNDILVNIDWDQTLFHTTFLQNGQTESLGYISILLLFQYFEYFLKNHIVVVVRYVLNSFDS